jgi:hypothetical protein
VEPVPVIRLGEGAAVVHQPPGLQDPYARKGRPGTSSMGTQSTSGNATRFGNARAAAASRVARNRLSMVPASVHHPSSTRAGARPRRCSGC